MKNGGFSNAGTATFGAGTIYFWDGSNGFTNAHPGADRHPDEYARAGEYSN